MAQMNSDCAEYSTQDFLRMPSTLQAFRKDGFQRLFVAVRSIAVACLLLLGLSSCLLNRVVTVKQQFCDFESNFALQFDDVTELRIQNPILLDKDILWISDAEPTSISEGNDELVMTWVIEKVMKIPEPENDFAIDLYFEQSDGQYKLNRVQMDPILRQMMDSETTSQELIEKMAMNVCETGWSFNARDVEYELSDEEIAMLPSRLEILEALGEPSEYLESESAFVYKFRPKNGDPESNIAKMVVWFDEAAYLPVKMESSYSRFTTRADFIERKMVFSLTL
jgi:hypothetical protein